MRQKLAIEAESHLVAFGDKDKFVPGGVGFPGNGELLRFQICYLLELLYLLLLASLIFKLLLETLCFSILGIIEDIPFQILI